MENIHGQKYTQEYLDSHLNKEEHTQTKKEKKNYDLGAFLLPELPSWSSELR